MCVCVYVCVCVCVVVKPGESSGKPNLEIYSGEERVAYFVQKKAQSW